MPNPVLQIIEAIRSAQSGNPIFPERGGVAESNRPDMVERMRYVRNKRRLLKMLDSLPNSPEGELFPRQGVNPPSLLSGRVSFPDSSRWTRDDFEKWNK